MTEQEGAEERVSTGVAEVDEVIASLEGLDGRPVEEHVEVYESAHDRLRRAWTAWTASAASPEPA